MGRLRAAVSVRQWWTLAAADLFSRRPVLADVSSGSRFALRKSARLDTALQQLPELGNTDGLKDYRLRPTLRGQIEDLPDGGSRLTAEFVDGVVPGAWTWIICLVLYGAIGAWLIHEGGLRWELGLLVVLWAITAPLLDLAFRLIRWLYAPDREVLVQFLDRLYGDVQVPATPSPAPAASPARRRRRPVSTRSIA
jgi:hypothetical protein